ncbi:MAG: 4Fe-4S dicluster domain-containing protein [Candidatus Thorarchaeota archaeon]
MSDLEQTEDHIEHVPNSDFTKEIEKEPGGEYIQRCIQCGMCTASCMVATMTEKYRPRKLIQQILLGMREEVLRSELPWLCMTCRQCEERCQEDVSLADIFRAVRNLAAKEGHIPDTVRGVVDKVMEDGWMLKDGYSDFIEDDRDDLGLETDLKWNTEFVRRVKKRYIDGVNKK